MSILPPFILLKSISLEKTRPSISMTQGVAATSSPAMNLDGRNPSSHQRPTNNGQQAIRHDHALVPVYVLLENLDAVHRYILSLGQPIFPAPESDYHPFLHPQSPDSPSEIDLSDESLNSVELTSIFSRLLTSTTLSTSTLGASTRNHAPAVAF